MNFLTKIKNVSHFQNTGTCHKCYYNWKKCHQCGALIDGKQQLSSLDEMAGKQYVVCLHLLLFTPKPKSPTHGINLYDFVRNTVVRLVI